MTVSAWMHTKSTVADSQLQKVLVHVHVHKLNDCSFPKRCTSTMHMHDLITKC